MSFSLIFTEWYKFHISLFCYGSLKYLVQPTYLLTYLSLPHPAQVRSYPFSESASFGLSEYMVFVKGAGHSARLDLMAENTHILVLLMTTINLPLKLLKLRLPKICAIFSCNLFFKLYIMQYVKKFCS